MLVLRGRKINLLLTRERSRRLLFCTDLGDRAIDTKAKAKAKVNCPWVENTSGLLASQSREHVSTTTILDTFDKIAHGGRDPKGMGHLSPNRPWDKLRLLVRQDRWYVSIASIRDI